MDSAVSQVPDDTFLLVASVFLLTVLLEVAAWIELGRSGPQQPSKESVRESQAELINRMVREAAPAPKWTAPAVAPAKTAPQRKSPPLPLKTSIMGEVPTLQTLSSTMSEADTDRHSSSSSTCDQEDNDIERKYREDVQ